MKTIALAVALVAPSLAAQQNIVWHDTQVSTNGNGNAFPFGVQGVRTQQLVPQSVLGSTPALIQDLFVNPQITSNATPVESQVWYGDYEIRMGITQLSTLTTTWATNLPNPTVVYRGPLLVRYVRDQWVPIGLPASYLWLPTSPADNLVIDFICWQVTNSGSVPPSVNGYFMFLRTSPSSSISRAYLLGWTNGQPTTSLNVDGQGIKLGFLVNDGNFVSHEGSCAASNSQVPDIGALPNTWPQLGLPFDVTLANAPATSIATLALGLEATSYLGVPLPLDMGVLGAPGCRFWHGWEVLLPVALTDPAGSATTTLALPAGSFNGIRLYGTWLVLDPGANAFGIVPSGFATMIL